MQLNDWSDYQAFLAIARTGQIARAAQAMRVDATTMGRRLRRLEARLGVTLFEQTREGQVLTEAGETLLAAVEAMDRAAGQIPASGTGGGLTGNLRVSTSEGFGSAFLVRYLHGFGHAHPGLTIDLVASSGFLSPSKREADIAIMLSRPQAGPVVARKLSDYALRLYASAAYLQERGVPRAPTDLAEGHHLVGYVPDLLYAPELGYLDEVHPGLRPSLRSSSINAQQRLIAHGAGIGVLPCFMAEPGVALVPVLPELRIMRSLWVVTHRDTRSLARISAFQHWLDRTVRENQHVLLGLTEK